VSVLAVEDLHVGFELDDGSEVHAVRGVSLGVERGARLGLVGESGCGKTTTLLALMGLLPANAWVSGRVLVDGQELLASGDASARPLRWTEIAMVPQGAMNALNPVRTIGRQIAEPMLVHGTQSKRAAESRTRELLALVGIPPERAGRYPHEFSGGMRQRVTIAMALACEPKVLLADEPTTALDVMVQAQVLALLARLCDELSLALLLVTHDLPVVAHVCGSAAVMYAGTLAEVGPVDTLYHDPGHPYTRRLFEATPELRGGRPLASIPGVPPPLDRPHVGCPFQPRCDRRFEPCPVITPALLQLDPQHAAACHLNDPAMT
jgi:oligopeptide/dipeptide ABC transporter ATP-binding protein